MTGMRAYRAPRKDGVAGDSRVTSLCFLQQSGTRAARPPAERPPGRSALRRCRLPVTTVFTSMLLRTIEQAPRLVLLIRLGAWRSLVAHSLGVRVVVGSNPAAPTFSAQGET